MFSLLLDEGISPAICPWLAEQNIDAVALRDRGKLRLSDYGVWTLANNEKRTIITINGKDFRCLAERSLSHFGVVILPSGSSRQEQLAHIITGVHWIMEKFSFMPTFINYVVEVKEGGEIFGSELRKIDIEISNRSHVRPSRQGAAVDNDS